MKNTTAFIITKQTNKQEAKQNKTKLKTPLPHQTQLYVFWYYNIKNTFMEWQCIYYEKQ